MEDGKTRTEVKADILDRLLTLGWVKIESNILRVNTDIELDARELLVAEQLVAGTEPKRKDRRCPVCLR